jgi:hypothetical protein
MDILLKIPVFLLGVYIVVATLDSAIRTFVLPRGVNTWLTRQIFRRTAMFFQWRAHKAATYEERDAVMAMFAPVALLASPVVWMLLVMLGYTLMFRAVGIPTWVSAFRLSGSSLLTLGIEPPPDPFTALLTFSEAILGLGLAALLIAYLPTMYSTFSRREVLVNLLEVRAGSPPSASEMIQRAQRIRGLEALDEIWVQWEQWFVELGETHTSLAALVFFRSTKPDRSWLTAAGAVLDCAAIVASTLDVPRNAARDLCIRAGYLALREIADYFRIPHNKSPKKDDPISITREEFDAVYDELQEAGVPLKPDRQQCWEDFAGWRVNYDRVLLALALVTMAPYAPWSSDRSLPDQRASSRLPNMVTPMEMRGEW